MSLPRVSLLAVILAVLLAAGAALYILTRSPVRRAPERAQLVWQPATPGGMATLALMGREIFWQRS